MELLKGGRVVREEKNLERVFDMQKGTGKL